MKKVLVAPSLLSADFSNLYEEIQKAQISGADWIHFDVMDGQFVNNISIGIPVVKSVSHCHNLVNDVHLMIKNPIHYAKRFVEAGADYVSFHYEACNSDKEVWACIDEIHEAGAKAGLVVKPDTPVDVVFPFLTSLEYVLIMSVEPGFGGQSFMRESLGKILRLRNYLEQNDLTKVIIQVDGGINEETGRECVQYGVDCLVAGNYLFGHDDMAERINKFKR